MRVPSCGKHPLVLLFLRNSLSLPGTFNFLAMKTAIYFLSVCLALCLAACNNQNEPEPNHQPANPKTFSLAGKMYVGDSEMIPELADGRFLVFSFTTDSIFYYQTSNTDLSPMGDFYRKTTYELKYPNIEVDYHPYPEIITMQDTLTIKCPQFDGVCILH